MKSRELFVEVFENYGYVLVEDASDGWYEDEGIIPYEDWLQFGFEYIPTGGFITGWPEYRHQGPYSIVLKTIEERYIDDPEIVEEIMETWTKL